MMAPPGDRGKAPVDLLSAAIRPSQRLNPSSTFACRAAADPEAEIPVFNAPSPREIRLPAGCPAPSGCWEGDARCWGPSRYPASPPLPTVIRPLSAVLSVALPVFGVIAAGVLAGKLSLATAEDSAALNRFVFRFAMPAALFSLMSGASGLKREDGLIALAYGLPACLVMMGGYVAARTVFRRGHPEAGALALACVLGNGVFLGLPIALGVDGWARPFVDLMLVEGILVIGVGTALMSAPGDDRQSAPAIFIRTLKNPVLVAALAGFALAAAGVVLPGPLRSFLDILGRAAGPVALFSLGLFFATRGFAVVKHAREVAAIAIFKMTLLPALSLAFLHLLGVSDPHYRGALALFTVVPTAVGAFIMASQYGRLAEETAAAVAATTAISVILISVVLAAFA